MAPSGYLDLKVAYRAGVFQALIFRSCEPAPRLPRKRRAPFHWKNLIETGRMPLFGPQPPIDRMSDFCASGSEADWQKPPGTAAPSCAASAGSSRPFADLQDAGDDVALLGKECLHPIDDRTH